MLPQSVSTDQPITLGSTVFIEDQPRVDSQPSLGTVLVVDDDLATLDMLQRFLAREGYTVVCAADGAEGLRLARELRPSAIILDVLLPGVDGWTVLMTLKADPLLAATPVIMLTLNPNRQFGYALGAADYLAKPFERERLSDILKRYHDASHRSSVLIVEDDAASRALLRRALEREGWMVREAVDGRAGLARVAEHAPDLILLDLMMPQVNGFAFLNELPRLAGEHAIPVIVLTARTLTSEDRAKLNGSVEAVLQKGSYNYDELLAKVRELLASSVH